MAKRGTRLMHPPLNYKYLELDPLLPQSSSAPEITGYGFFQHAEIKRSSPIQGNPKDEVFEDREDIDSLSQVGSRTASLRIIMAIFTVVVGLALFITSLIPGGLGKPSHISNRDYQARAETLLSENPLIGPRPPARCQ